MVGRDERPVGGDAVEEPDLVGRVGRAGELDAGAVLVGPEVARLVDVLNRAPGEQVPHRDGRALRRVRPVLPADVAAGARVVRPGDVAHGDDVRAIGDVAGVGENTVVQEESGVGQPSRRRRHPDADDDDVRAQPAPVTELQGGHPGPARAVVGREPVHDRRAGEQGNAVGGVQSGAHRAQLRPERDRQGHRHGLDDRHVQAEGAGRGGDFRADEPGADDHDVLGAAGQLGPERVRVVQAAQDVHPEQSLGGRQAAGHAAGGDDDPVRRDLLTRGEDDPATGDVEPLRRDTQVPPRVELVDVRLLGERQVVGPHRPEQVLLGQRRTVVGQVRLCADDDEVVVVALGPELLGGPQPGQRGSDDGDRPAGHATPCRVRASTRSSASSAGAGAGALARAGASTYTTPSSTSTG